MAARKKRTTRPTPLPFRIGSLRLITLNNQVKPDDSFFRPDPLQPRVKFSVQNAALANNGTTFLFNAEASLPFTGDQPKKGNAWTVSATFFVYLRHATQEKGEISGFIRTVVAPMLNLRFIGVVEHLASMAGISVQSVASAGMSIFEVSEIEIQDFEIEEAKE